MKIENSINLLEPNFKRKVELFLAEANREHKLNVVIFESKRSYQRQVYLYSFGRTRNGRKRTWSLKSSHLDGLAVDIVFLKNGQPSWSKKHNWKKLIEIGVKYKMKNLFPLETCHFQQSKVRLKPMTMTERERRAIEKIKELYGMVDKFGNKEIDELKGNEIATLKINLHKTANILRGD